MAASKALLLLRIGLLLAMAACAALAVEYRGVEASFCAANSGCAALRRTELAWLWGIGITLPELGLLATSLTFALSLSRAVKWSAILSLVGALIAAALLLAQAVWLSTFCWLCVTVDVSSLVAGLGGALWLRALRARQQEAERGLANWAWAALAAVAVLGPFLWPSLKPTPPVPEVIRALYVPGKINVVEFADFECPWCRNLHARLKPLLAPYGSRVHFVRLNMPLDRHSLAKGAALASICSEAGGKSHDMSEFLFATEDLSPEAIRAHAGKLGLDLAEYDRCLDAPQTIARLQRDMNIMQQAGFEGLPTTYVGGRRVIGAQPDDVFRDALDRAARGEGERGVPGWAYLAIVLGAVLTIVRFGITPKGTTLKPTTRAAAEQSR